MRPVFQLSYNPTYPPHPTQGASFKVHLCVGASHHHCFNTSHLAIGCWCFLLVPVSGDPHIPSFVIRHSVVHPSSSCITASLTSYYILIYHVKIQ